MSPIAIASKRVVLVGEANGGVAGISITDSTGGERSRA